MLIRRTLGGYGAIASSVYAKTAAKTARASNIEPTSVHGILTARLTMSFLEVKGDLPVTRSDFRVWTPQRIYDVANKQLEASLYQRTQST
jgi:hypothetical protein